MKKILSIVLTAVLLSLYIVPSSAQNAPSPKEEVIYGILNCDGSVKNIYAVNIFAGGAIDYGDYTDIRNLTTSEQINVNGDKITVNTDAKKFYYQGTLKNKDLPWDISIKYFLDGKGIPAEELGGKSGALRIRISVKRNDKAGGVFFDNYALQITLSLDGRSCSNITADNATIAEAGGKKQIAFTVLPGKGADIEVTADVRDFELEPISISGIRLAFDIDIDTGVLTGRISELADAVKSIDDGAAGLLDGITRLSDGLQQYIEGMKAFKDGLGQLSAGAEKLYNGALPIKEGLSELTKQNESVLAGALAMQQAIFDSVNLQLAGMGLPVLTPDNYGAILSAIPGLDPVRQRLDGVVQFTQGLESYLDGVSQLDGGAAALAAGISEFKLSASAIPESANALYDAAAELNTAIKELRDGFASFKAGTGELREGTAGIGAEMDNKINEILSGIFGDDEKAVSFVSPKNTNVSSVQFVLKTEPIQAPKTDSPAAPEPVRLTFWQRLLKLFGLYKG